MFEDLVRGADVVVEAMRPGFLAKMGLGYDRLQELNPKIVMCTISGLRRHRPVPEPAEPRHRVRRVVGHHPARRSTTTASAHIPDQANIGITAGPAFGADRHPRRAHPRAEKTGEGASMEIAQSDSSRVLRLVPHRDVEGLRRLSRRRRHRQPERRLRTRAPGLGGMWEGVRYQYYESSDGHILFMASEQSFWKNFCEGVGRTDLFEKWPGKTIADHARGNKELQAELRDIFRTRTSQEWIDFADEHNTPIAPANTAQTVRHDPQFQDRFDVDDVRQTRAPTCCCSRCTSRARAAGADQGARGRGAHRAGAARRAGLRRRQGRGAP